MNNLEELKKLEAYRAAKRRQEKIDKYKESIRNLFKFKKPETVATPENDKLITESTSQSNPTKPVIGETQTETSTYKKRGKQVAIFTTWLLFYILFIKIEFGIIYLIVSALIGMYYNTRTGPRNASEVSAYSVFNENCESIDGTLKAEQFEKEIRFGAQSVH